MKHIYLYLVSFLLLIYSCKKEAVPNDPLLHFSKEITEIISPTSILDLGKYEVFKPEIVLKYLNGYVVKSQTQENVITYIDLISNKTISGINRGDGPEELVSPSSIQKRGDDLFIYDLAKKKIYQLDIVINDSTISLSKDRTLNVEDRPFIIHMLDKGYIASGLFLKFWMAYLDDNGYILSSLNFPDFEDTKNFTDIELSTLYLSTLIAVSPNEQKVVCAAQKGGVLAFANLSSKGMEEYKLLKYHAPKISESHKRGNPNVAFSKDGKMGFSDVACNEKYVFTLYSGRTYRIHGTTCHHCEHLLIYDWDGNPVKHLVLDKPLFTMNYDAQSNKLYGVGYDPEGCILEYDLEGVI